MSLTIGPCITPKLAPPAFSSKPPAIWAAKFCMHTHTEEHKNTNLRLNTRITIYFNTLTERRGAERTGQKKLTPPSPGGFGPGGPGGPGLPGVPGSPSLPLGPGLPWWEKKESKEKTLAQSLSHDKTLLSVMPYSLLCLSSLGEKMSKMSTDLPSHP